MEVTRVGVFGGSFNPPHFGHVLAACWVMGTGRVDRLLVIPTLSHPFAKALAPYPHRRRMAELAFAGVEGVAVSDLEARMGGPSYTVDTLERLRRELPGVELHLVIGTDLVSQIPSWHEGHRIEELARLLVVGRGGHAQGEEDIVMPAISSTEVRRRLAAGEPATSIVPKRVLDYVGAHGLYRGEP